MRGSPGWAASARNSEEGSKRSRVISTGVVIRLPQKSAVNSQIGVGRAWRHAVPQVTGLRARPPDVMGERILAAAEVAFSASRSGFSRTEIARPPLVDTDPDDQFR